MGSSCVMSEMEMQQLFGSGMRWCMQELQDRSDLIETKICSACKVLSMACHCDDELRHQRCVIPWSTVKFAAYIRCSAGLDMEFRLGHTIRD